MKFEVLIESLTAERYEILKRSVELGKWPDGRLLGSDERETSLQILIAYDLKYKATEDRIGYVPTHKETICEHEHEPNADFPAIKNLIVKN